MSTKEVFSDDNLIGDDGLCTGNQQQARERIIFELALALAPEPPKLGELRQMLVRLQKRRVLSLDFFTWALRQIDERLRAMALEYAHDAETLLQILSFKGRTFAGLQQDIEDLYQHEQITQRVYVTVKLLLRTNIPPRPE